MSEQAKRKSNAGAYRKRADALEAQFVGLIEHIDRLQDQQLIQHVQLTALRELLVEGRPITSDSFNTRCDMIYKGLVESASKEAEDGVSKAESTDSIATGADMVDGSSEVSGG